MSENLLDFVKVQDDKDIRLIHEFNVKAFSDEDLSWTYENLKSYIAKNWELHTACYKGNIVAAMFLKRDGDALLTRNTSIGVDYQGNGYSHMIKDYMEEQAYKMGLKKVVNYCPFDNFRMISLNERHYYKKTGNSFGADNEIIEWEKLI